MVTCTCFSYIDYLYTGNQQLVQMTAESKLILTALTSKIQCRRVSARKRESIIGVQWGQGNPNPRVHRSSGKRGFAEFPTGTVDPRVGISRFHSTPMIDSISHISNKNLNLRYIWRGTVATYFKVHSTSH